MAVILIVDDDVSHRAKLDQIISKKLEHETIVFDNGQKVVDYMLWRQEPIPDIILLDLFMPGMDGLEVIQNLQQTHPDLPIIALTMSGAVNRSTEAIAAGAYDYVPKPVTTERLHLAIQHALEVRNLRKDVSQWKPLSTFSLSLSDYAGYSDSYAQAIAKAQQAANNDMTVIIEGEAGVGKSCMARAIHNNSDRCNTPFITLDTTQDLDSLQMYIDKAEGGTIMANHRDHAPEGFFNARVQGLVDALNNHDIAHDYYVGGNGGHDWSTWRHLLYYRFLPNLWEDLNN